MRQHKTQAACQTANLCYVFTQSRTAKNILHSSASKHQQEYSLEIAANSSEPRDLLTPEYYCLAVWCARPRSNDIVHQGRTLVLISQIVDHRRPRNDQRRTGVHDRIIVY